MLSQTMGNLSVFRHHRAKNTGWVAIDFALFFWGGDRSTTPADAGGDRLGSRQSVLSTVERPVSRFSNLLFSQCAITLADEQTLKDCSVRKAATSIRPERPLTYHRPLVHVVCCVDDIRDNQPPEQDQLRAAPG